MFNAKSKFVKFVGYAIIGFFGLIIVISFGMPDFLSKMGIDTSVAAIVNGKKIHTYDYLRFRDRYREQLGNNPGKQKEVDNIIFNNFIGEVLLIQDAVDIGLEITEERMMTVIREMKEFQNPSTGRYDPERLKLVLRQNGMSINELIKLLKKGILKGDYFKIIQMGMAVPSEEIRKEYIIDNSNIKIKYAFLSSAEMEKRFSGNTTVSNEEIQKEMSGNIKEIKDPETDRERVKKKLIKKKQDEITNSLVEKINKIADSSGPFNIAAGILKGQTGTSETFKIGETVKETGNKGKVLSDLSNSRIFRESCLSLKKGATSKAIKTDRGMYIFTTLVADIKTDTPPKKLADSISESLASESFDMTTNRLMTTLSEKAKVVKNLKSE